MSDAKDSSAAKHPAALKLWTDRLRPAIGSALLDDLIGLIGEYCLSRLSWSPTLRTKRSVIADADGDGFGRVLQFLNEPPAGEIETPSLYSWYAALSAAPISEMAGGSSVFSWAVRVDEWGDSGLTAGVAFPDAKVVAPPCGVCDRAYGAFMASSGAWPCAVHNAARVRDVKRPTESLPRPATDAVVQIRLTADLTANTVRVAVEHVQKVPRGRETHTTETEAAAMAVPSAKWLADGVFSVPDLSQCHLHAAGARTMRLTLMP